MIVTAAAFLALLLALGYVASREHVKRRDAEATADDWMGSHAALEVRFADAEASAHTWQTLQAAEAELKRKAMEDRDWERMLRVIAEDERDTAQTALRGLLDHQARVDLMHPDEPVAEAAGVIAETSVHRWDHQGAIADWERRLLEDIDREQREAEAGVVPLKKRGAK